jgi:hypothetical protein
MHARPLVRFVHLHLTLGLLVEFVANASEGETAWVVGSCVFEEDVLPLLHVSERGLIGDVVEKGTAVSATVESVTETLELFLASRVPYLQRHSRVVNHYLLLAEVGPDRRLGLTLELARDVLLKQGGLSDTRVAQNHDFQLVFLFSLHIASN